MRDEAVQEVLDAFKNHIGRDTSIVPAVSPAMSKTMYCKANTVPTRFRILDNHSGDRLLCNGSDESLPPKHADVHANANLRSRAAVSGEVNDPLVDLLSEDSVTRSVPLAGFSFCASHSQLCP